MPQGRPTSVPVAPAVAPGRLPGLGHALDLWRRPIMFLESLRSFGDVVRVHVGSWPIYVLTNAELVHTVLVADSHSFGRGRVFERLRPLFGNGIVTSDGTFHRKQRRLMQPAFHHDRIAAYAQVMCDRAHAMSASWRTGQTIAVNREMRQLALSAVAGMMFSGDLGRPAVAEVHRSLPVVLHGMLARAVVPKKLDRLPIPVNRRFDAAAARLRQVIDEVIAEYRSGEQTESDLLSVLLSSKDAETGETMSDEQVRDEVIAIMFAGTETPATVLSWIFHELGRHPQREERLHAEVDDVVGTRPVRPDDVARLRYTNHVFTEALRLHSPLLFTRRALAPVQLGGFSVPAGAEVAYSPYALHRDPALFPAPAEFKPERWDATSEYRPHASGFIPFGAGQHKCIGDSFAAAEIVIAVASVASQWRLVPAPGSTVREVAAGIPQPDVLPMIPLARH